ncbi:MAG: hypothetical protein HZB92_00520 [Euryarchaeota archaeon]|nr:hypothetical protein [Euryarchaeota archaeon]
MSKTIKYKMLFAFLGVGLIPLLIMGGTGINLVNIMGNDAVKASNDIGRDSADALDTTSNSASDALTQATSIAVNESMNALVEQAEECLVDYTALSASNYDDTLERVRNDASVIAAYVANIFDNPTAFANEAYWNFDEHVFKGTGGQYMNGPNDPSCIFIPNYSNISSEDIRHDAELSAYLDLVFPKFLENNPNAVAIWLITHHDGFSRYYPNIGLGDVLPPDVDNTQWIFFTAADPRNNPGREVVWTPVYDDPAGQGLMTSALAPVYTKNKEFYGVIGIDLTLNNIIKNIEENISIEQSYSFLIDKDGYSIALPAQAYLDILGRSQHPDDVRIDLNDVTNEFSSVLNKMKIGSTGFESINISDKVVYTAYAPIPSSNWSLGAVVPESEVLASVYVTQLKLANASIQAIVVMNQTIATSNTALDNSIEYTTSSTDSRKINVIFSIIGVLVLELAIAIIAAIIMSSRISSPIDNLTKTTNEISMALMEDIGKDRTSGILYNCGWKVALRDMSTSRNKRTRSPREFIEMCVNMRSIGNKRMEMIEFDENTQKVRIRVTIPVSETMHPLNESYDSGYLAAIASLVIGEPVKIVQTAPTATEGAISYELITEDLESYEKSIYTLDNANSIPIRSKADKRKTGSATTHN